MSQISVLKNRLKIFKKWLNWGSMHTIMLLSLRHNICFLTLIPQKHRKGHHVVYNPLFDSFVFGFSLLTALQLELQEISAILPVLNHSDVLNLFISQKSMFLVLTRKGWQQLIPLIQIVLFLFHRIRILGSCMIFSQKKNRTMYNFFMLHTVDRLHSDCLCSKLCNLAFWIIFEIMVLLICKFMCFST